MDRQKNFLDGLRGCFDGGIFRAREFSDLGSGVFEIVGSHGLKDGHAGRGDVLAHVRAVGRDPGIRGKEAHGPAHLRPEASLFVLGCQFTIAGQSRQIGLAFH